MPFLIIIPVLILALLIACIKIVPQATEFVVEFLGKYQKTWSAGIHWKWPFIQVIAKKVT